MAGEGSYSESRNGSRGVSEKPFSCGKKGWGEPSDDKSGKTQYIEHFKIEGLHCLKFLLKQNDFLYKIDPKGAYFAIPLSKQSSQYATSTRFSAFVLD